jgi:hypothetical protein
MLDNEREVNFGLFTTILLLVLVLNSCGINKNVERIAKVMEKQYEESSTNRGVSDVQPSSEEAGLQTKDL